jgi:hypothetical protein
MPDELHDYLDEQFKKKFGWKARSEGVFCVRSKQIAYNYGNPYSVFPIGNYKYIYSNKIHDLYVHFDELKEIPAVFSILRDDAPDNFKYWSDSTWEDYLKLYGRDKNGQWIHKGKPIDKKDFEKYEYPSLDWKPEIEYEEYIEDMVLELREKLYKYIDKIMRTYKTTNLKDSDLKAEIMLKCDEYYMLGETLTDEVMDRIA